METKARLINHFRFLHRAADKVGGEALLNCSTFYVQVRIGKDYLILYPQFIVFVEGNKHYTPRFTEDAHRFAGWRPYVLKRVERFSDKIALKERVSREQILTPAYSTTPTGTLGNVVVKQRASSFGSRINGPFKQSADVAFDAQSGEYLEQFVPGRIVKAWYWNDKPVCLEVRDMPAVIGDGKRTIEELIEWSPGGRAGASDLQRADDMLRFFDRSRGAVLEAGEAQTVDFRYGSILADSRHVVEYALSGDDIPQVQPQLARIGTVLWDIAAEAIKGDLAYTADLIWDPEDRLWLLEANANPMMHPRLYLTIIKDWANRHTIANGATV